MTHPNRSKTRVPDLRVSRILKERVRSVGGYSALARAITFCNPDLARGKGGADVIHRRKLKQLAEGAGDLTLYLSDFLALDRYLGEHGEGLAYLPMFDRPDLLRSLAESDHVAFLVGAKPERTGLRVNVDHCDVKAMVDVQRSINGFASKVRFETLDIEVLESLEQVRAVAERSEWKRLTGGDGPSLVSLASSRSNPATEWLLSKMFGVHPFVDADADTKRALPFQFVWKAGVDAFPSAFHATPDDSEAPDDASSLRVEGKLYVDQISQRGYGHTYGLCVAQRRQPGQLWVVAAGITGLATYAAAKLLKEIDTRLEQQTSGRRSRIFVAVVRATLAEKQSRSFESLHTIRDEQVVCGPRPFKPVPRGARSAGTSVPAS